MGQQQQPTKVAILGAYTMVEKVLSQLLEGVNYNTRIPEPYPTDLIGEPLDGVDVLLLASRLDASCVGPS
jgi:hypothetical protein